LHFFSASAEVLERIEFNLQEMISHYYGGKNPHYFRRILLPEFVSGLLRAAFRQ
jgi:hypothetical protein